MIDAVGFEEGARGDLAGAGFFFWALASGEKPNKMATARTSPLVSNARQEKDLGRKARLLGWGAA